jgi:hypothetical protein
MSLFLNQNTRLSGPQLSDKFCELTLKQWPSKAPNKIAQYVFHWALKDFLVPWNKMGIRDDIGLTENNVKLIQAINEISNEVGMNFVNDYHDTYHTASVTMMSAYFMKQWRMHHIGDVDMYLVGVCAAMGHDLWHPGKGNPEDDCAFNERHSAQKVADILRKHDVDEKTIEQVTAIIISTSPNGPHQFVKSDFKEGTPQPEQEILRSDPLLLEITKIVCDADLFASAGVNLISSQDTSKKLTKEASAAGQNINFETPESLLYFLDNIVGKNGFSSEIAQDLANINFHHIREATKDSLAPANRRLGFD